MPKLTFYRPELRWGMIEIEDDHATEEGKTTKIRLTSKDHDKEITVKNLARVKAQAGRSLMTKTEVTAEKKFRKDLKAAREAGNKAAEAAHKQALADGKTKEEARASAKAAQDAEVAKVTRP